MPVLETYQTSFDFGELSPRLAARIDLPAYKRGLKTQENSYSLLHGGATKRRGTMFMGALYNELQKARLIPYIYDTNNEFILVFNGGRIQFLKRGVNGYAFVESSPGVRYFLNHSFTEAQLSFIRYTQPGNTMFLTHRSHHPVQLSRISDANWTLANIPFIYKAVSDVNFENAFIRFKILNGSVKFVQGQNFTITTAGGSITGITGITGGAGNGQVVAVTHQPGPAVAETWTVTCTLATDARQEWSVVGSVSGASPSMWRVNNYPQCVLTFNQRLYFASSPQYPQHVWGSVAGDFLNFTVGTAENDAVIIPILSNDHASIQHLVGGRDVMPMTTSTEFTLSGMNSSAVAGGPGQNNVKAHTQTGCSSVRPTVVGREVIYIQRDGKKVRASSYSMQEDMNLAPDITVFSEHLTKDTTITDMTFASSPDYITWMVRSDGVLLSLMLAREYEAIAWARHVTDGQFEAVASLPGDGVVDVFFVVKRTINGVQRRFVEMFDYEEIDTAYSDSSIYYVGAPTTTIGGFDHLIGKELAIVADGVVHPARTVNDDGEIELQAEASVVLAGLPFNTKIELMHPEFGDPSRSTAGSKVMITDVTVKFHNTTVAKVNGDDVIHRSTSDGLDTPPVPFSGDIEVKGGGGWTSPHHTRIESDNPTPMTVLGVITRASVN